MHKPEHFVDARNKRCGHQGCLKNRSFGKKGGERLWCYDHKSEYCVNLVETFCAMACCMYEEIQGKYFHPDHQKKDSEFFGKRICSFARRFLIEDALMSRRDNDYYTEVKKLLGHFGLKEVVTLNAQSAFRMECEKEYYDLLVEVVFDNVVHGGPKVLGDQRPDIFYKWRVNDQDFAIHIEYDENSCHEDDSSRLDRIAREAGCEGKTYVIRVQGGHDTKNPVCRDVRKEYYKYSVVTESGKEVCREVAGLVKERIGWIEQGLGPNSQRLAKIEV